MISIHTAGESHGKAGVVIIDGMPAGVQIDATKINNELRRRQKGYGRGKRMRIEKDRVNIVAGVRYGKTIGTPVCLMVENKDYKNWPDVMSVDSVQSGKEVTAPRPGHADLAGILKFGFSDIRNVLERASARETAARVLAGAMAKQFLKEFGISFSSHTIQIGTIKAQCLERTPEQIEKSPLCCGDPQGEKEMIDHIDKMKKKGDTLGGIIEIRATGVCPGLGSYSHYEKRYDAQIALAMLSIPSVKGVEIGTAFENAYRPGSEVHDKILYAKDRGFYRKTNRAGGTEGGVSNGEDIIVHLAVKPIPSLKIPLHSVDLVSKETIPAQKERADVCVVPAVGVIGETMLALVTANLFMEKFGGDCLDDCKSNFAIYQKRIQNV